MQCFEKRPSGVAGFGVFALAPIAAGTAVFEMGGTPVPAAQVAPDARAMQIGPDAYVVAEEESDELENYINHCCEPNLGFRDGSLVLYALRDIAAGEELFWDYSTAMSEPDWSIPCGCGAARCRGRVQGFFDLPPSAREALRPIALAYLR